jgi:hypothetical protein
MNEEQNSRTKSSLLWGSLFILIGLALIANMFLDIEIFSMRYLWPLFVLVPGLLFESSYYTYRKAPGLLVPGGILITISILFFFEVFTHWHFAAYTWPVYIVGVVVGLFQFYLATGKPRGVLVAIGVLALVAGCSAVSIVCDVVFRIEPHRIILPAMFILIGGYIVYKGFRK